MKSEPEELKLLLRSRLPILVVETAEKRFLALIENLTHLEELALFTWSVGKGLQGSRLGSGVAQTRELGDALFHWADGRTAPAD